MALLEGTLEGAAVESLRAHLGACSRCREEFEAFRRIGEDLTSLGDAALANAPSVDLVDAVMAEVAQLKAAVSTKVVPFTPPARQSRFRATHGFLAAAAAMAAIWVFFWASGYRITKAPVTPTAMHTQVPGGSATSSTVAPPSAEMMHAQRDLKGRIQDLSHGAPGPRWAKTEPVVRDDAEISSLSLTEVLAARRDAITSPEARTQLARWASLTAEKAKELALSETTPLDAKLGTINTLETEDAKSVLQAALKARPNDAYLRSRMADLYSIESGSSEKAIAELETASRLDPQNALIQYQLAAQLLEGGDIEGATAALELARSLQLATQYVAQTAGYQEQALIESGIDPDVAKMLAALTAGTDQYSSLTGLGDQLLEYGRYYEQNGDADLAQQIYEAVRTMGSQIAESATYSTEQLAGLDIERAALEMLSGLVTVLQSPESLEILSTQIDGLQIAFTRLGEFMTALDQLFASSDQSLLTGQVADYIMRNGDLGLFSYLSGS